MKKSMIMGLVVLVIVGGAAYLLLNKKDSKTPTPNNTSTTPSTQSANPTDNNQAAATITYSSSNFSPENTVVKSGDTVAIKNLSSEDIQFESNPHPAHTDNTELNVGIVGPGQTETFTVTNKGTFGFHNHLSIGATGTITVQ